MSEIAGLEQRALAELAACGDRGRLAELGTRAISARTAKCPPLSRRSRDVPPADRRAFGQEANRVKQALTTAYESALATQQEQALARSLAAEALDVTLPGRPLPRGRLHVATRVMREIYAIFADLGFQVYRSREVEDD